MSAYRPRFGARDVEVVRREASFEGYFAVETLTIRHRLFEGACSEQIRLFIGEAIATRPGTLQGLDTEQKDILVHQMPSALALDMLDRNEINNAHTLIALQWLARHDDRLKAKWAMPTDD